MTSQDFQPYCGGPPVPGALHWNLDFVLIGVLAICFGTYALCFRSRALRISQGQFLLGSAGVAVLAASLITPLCNLSVALFTARAVQHGLILLTSAPLLVSGMPRGRPGRLEAVAAPLAFAATLWFWHLPVFYDATLTNNFVYWVMHLTLFITALSLWRVLLAGEAFVVGSLFTGIQMCALGALLTLSARPWFSVYEVTTWPWGLSQSADQQLGGVVMWVIGGILLSAFTIISLARVFASASPAPRLTSSTA